MLNEKLARFCKALDSLRDSFEAQCAMLIKLARELEPQQAATLRAEYGSGDPAQSWTLHFSNYPRPVAGDVLVDVLFSDGSIIAGQKADQYTWAQAQIPIIAWRFASRLDAAEERAREFNRPFLEPARHERFDFNTSFRERAICAEELLVAVDQLAPGIAAWFQSLSSVVEYEDKTRNVFAKIAEYNRLTPRPKS